VKPVLAYTLLLVASLGLAYQTWTRGDTVLSPGSLTLWTVDMDKISSIVYEAADKRVAIERREDEGPYLWGSVTRSVLGDSVSAASDTTTEFLVGQGADGLLALLAAPRILRNLGMLNAEREEEYGLDGSLESLVVQADRETHELLLGATVFGTNDRYVRDAASGRAYVLQGATLGSLVSAEQVYSETRLHAFTLDAVAAVTVRTERGERAMHKSSTGSSGSPSWTPTDAPDRPDQTFANFMERLGQLWVSRYEPSIDRGALREVARIEYVDAAGNSLGYTELLLSNGGGEPVYYLATEHTRVPITLVSGAAERLNQDLAQLL
jgi:hypothetical protein